MIHQIIEYYLLMIIKVCKFTSSDIAQLQQNTIGRELRISSDIFQGTIDLGFSQDSTIVGYMEAG